MKTFASYEDAKKEIDRFNSLISELYDVSTISSKIDYVYFFLINNKYVYAAAINKVPNIEVGAQNEFSYELYFVELTPDCSEIKIPYKGVEKFKANEISEAKKCFLNALTFLRNMDPKKEVKNIDDKRKKSRKKGKC